MKLIQTDTRCPAIFGEGEAELVWEKDYVRVTGRKEVYASFAVHTAAVLGEKQGYRSKMWVRLPAGRKPMRISLYQKLIMEYLDVRETNYVKSDAVEITDREWTCVAADVYVPFGSKIFDVITYFITDGSLDDVLVRECEIEEAPVQDPADLQPWRKLTPLKKQDKMLVGTIRWDAFEESHPTGKLPCDQVARVLSPRQYHWQTPFFGKINNDGTVSFPPYTLATWEAELDYAVKYGLDYFAYLWYESSSEMSQARKAHLQSARKDEIKMCAVFEAYTNRSEQTKKDFWEALNDSCYLRLDGRPVVFLYGLDRWKKESIQNMLADIRDKAGIQEEPYVIGMTTQATSLAFETNYLKGVDAISWYSVGAYKTAMTYEELKDSCEDTIRRMSKLCALHGMGLAPAFTAGRDTRARIQTGVSWCAGDPNATDDKLRPYHNCYALPPTPAELKAHILYTLRYVKEHEEVCTPNLVCSYGWNEHEEGGWLCPTITCNEQGDPVCNADGSYKANTERLEILQQAIREV